MFRSKAFTLAELLIALGILGVIATFTIPKVLQAQQNGKYKAIAKETAGMFSGALEAYKKDHTLSAATGSSDLTPYMNYVRVDTSTWADDTPLASPYQCNTGSNGCLLLHNGALLVWNRDSATFNFGGTASTNAVGFWLDPDGGTNNGSSTGAYPAVVFLLYYNGRLTSMGKALPNTRVDDYFTASGDPNDDPSWFSW